MLIIVTEIVEVNVSDRSTSKTVTNLLDDSTPRKIFWNLIPSLSMGWFKSKNRNQKMTYPTREELQNLFDEDLRGAAISKNALPSDDPR